MMLRRGRLREPRCRAYRQSCDVKVYCQFISARKKDRCEALGRSDQQTDSSGFGWFGRRVDGSEELEGSQAGRRRDGEVQESSAEGARQNKG